MPGHVSDRLAAYVDAELTPRSAQQVERHLELCARCRTDCEDVRSGIAMMDGLQSFSAPDAIWVALQAQLRASRAPRRSFHRPAARTWRVGALAALVMIALSGTAAWLYTHPSGVRWDVRRLEGKPAVGGKPTSGEARIGVGEWIETDASSRARVAIGDIGSVEIAPGTRVRVVATRPDEHRLALARGEIRAAIFAPPKLFFVDTPSGTAVDLGCEYALSTDENGFGLLHVTRGWVSFQWSGLESLVPAGASCSTRPHIGPGLPYFDDATDAMKRAVAAFGREKVEGGALNTILAESRLRDTLTLWHLLSRVDVGDRSRVYDRIAELVPVPAGVSRGKALELDPETLTRWREALAWTW